MKVFPSRQLARDLDISPCISCMGLCRCKIAKLFNLFYYFPLNKLLANMQIYLPANKVVTLKVMMLLTL